MVAAWWKERIRYVGPYGERTTVVFIPISADTGLDKVHPTWAGTYILDACVFLFPSINFALVDSDCVPVTLFEIQELWLSCVGHDPPEEGLAPGFRIELCCFLHPLKWPIVILRLVLLLLISMGICMRRDDTKLSPLASIDPFHP